MATPRSSNFLLSDRVLSIPSKSANDCAYVEISIRIDNFAFENSTSSGGSGGGGDGKERSGDLILGIMQDLISEAK
ncbi:Hypothetical predicted protein [Octopus vulgaris]|uniref:Uncharacterized protein n=1 Tax=Octopus vulgaris TaxID=6645 RepID=A0AA36BD93_OCTVU|nr:Hypothetical predicted protein [Octopus vulgaris]